jgi:hypothetical protein
MTSQAGRCPSGRWTTGAWWRENNRVLRRAPTLAGLDGDSDIRQGRVTEATGDRSLDREPAAR